MIGALARPIPFGNRWSGLARILAPRCLLSGAESFELFALGGPQNDARDHLKSSENLSTAACAPFKSGTELSLLRPQLRRIAIEFCRDIFPGQFRGGGIMSGHIPRPVGSIALVATLLVSGVGIGVPANIARADHCLSAPNSLAPQGSHWYYQLDWATQRKCWYLRAFRPPAQQAVASATSARGHTSAFDASSVRASTCR